jgi:hypothetical protein
MIRLVIEFCVFAILLCFGVEQFLIGLREDDFSLLVVTGFTCGYCITAIANVSSLIIYESNR